MDEDQRDYAGVVPFPATISLEPIGVVRSPYKQRHGTPRQPRVNSPKEHVESATVELFSHRVQPAVLNDLGSFSHLWVLSWFHLNGPRKKSLVRPPRGGPKRGVLSTRAPHRPVPIGLSLAEVIEVQGLFVRLVCLDLIDGTPVLDLKPYIPDYDCVPHANRGWLDEP